MQSPAPALTVAILGAGPAGLYVADSLLFDRDRQVRVDVFERLPTPFGLLRYGVAPDHLKMKSLTRVLQRTIDDDRLRLVAGVEVGRDVTVAELRDHYDVVVHAFGASADRRLGVPGEDLAGSDSATRFVQWYSGFPDVSEDAFDLSATSATVVGVGNVAVDVARMLLKDAAALASTDVPARVLETLRSSSIRDVHLLGRRGPEHASFTSKELRELGELEGVDVVVEPLPLPTATGGVAPEVARNLAVLQEWAQRPPSTGRRRLHLHFWSRPVRLTGKGNVDGLLVERTALASGALVGTGQTYQLPAQLVLRSVGYRGRALPGVPFDETTGTVPNADGRVLRDGVVSPGEYVVGWIGRGPVGVLGTNRSDAEAVVERILADRDGFAARRRDDLVGELAARGVVPVDCLGWRAIDTAEVDRGRAEGRARAKLATWAELLSAAHSAREPA